MIVTLCNLQIFFSWKKSTYLLQCFWWNDQIATWSSNRRNWKIHPSQAVTVSCHHTHPLWTKLPQHTIENWPAFFSRDCKRSMRYQLLKISRPNSPALLEPNLGKCWEFVSWKS